MTDEQHKTLRYNVEALGDMIAGHKMTCDVLSLGDDGSVTVRNMAVMPIDGGAKKATGWFERLFSFIARLGK